MTPGGRRTEEELAELGSELAETEESVERTTSDLLLPRPRLARFLRLVRGVMREQAEEQVGLAAAGAAFWLIIAAFPTAIAAVNIFGLVVSPHDVATDLGSLASAGPSTFGATMTTQLQRVAAADHVGLSTGLAISLVLAIWSASGGVYNLDRGIRTAYDLPPQRYVDARGRALVGAVGAVIALGALAFASAAVSGGLADVPAALVAAVGVPVLIVCAASAIATLYRFSVGRRMGFRAIVPGSVASAVGLALVVAGFSTYLRFSSRYAAVYGALAGAVIAMVGTFLAVYVVLLGAVLNMQLDNPSSRLPVD